MLKQTAIPIQATDLFRVALLFQFHLHALAHTRRILSHAVGMLFPGLAELVLLVQADGTKTVSRLGTKHRVNSALSAWHNGGSVRKEMPHARERRQILTKIGIVIGVNWLIS